MLLGGLSEPTGLAFTPDGRMLIIERGGRIRVVQPGAVLLSDASLAAE